jgi:acyl-homoserine lactone acylase PvdQ
MWATFAIFKKQPKVTNPQMGENSPNQVTLRRVRKTCYPLVIRSSSGDALLRTRFNALLSQL